MNTVILEKQLKGTTRRPGAVVDTIVLHATAGRESPANSVANAVATLRKGGLGYHYLVAKDGTVYKAVATGMGTGHAGSSYGPQEQAKGISRTQFANTKANRAQGRVHKFVAGTSVNSTSIAVSLVNLNDGQDDYTQAQLDAVEALVKQLKSAMPTLKFLTTHFEVSPKRKSDPIEYPVAALAAKTGLTHWRFPEG